MRIIQYFSLVFALGLLYSNYAQENNQLNGIKLIYYKVEEGILEYDPSSAYTDNEAFIDVAMQLLRTQQAKFWYWQQKGEWFDDAFVQKKLLNAVFNVPDLSLELKLAKIEKIAALFNTDLQRITHDFAYKFIDQGKEFIEFLIARGSKIDGEALAWSSAQIQEPELLKLLIDYDPSIKKSYRLFNKVANYSFNACFPDQAGTYRNILDDMFEHRKKIGLGNEEFLLNISKIGDDFWIPVGCVQWLLPKGVNPNAQDKNGNTALDSIIQTTNAKNIGGIDGRFINYFGAGLNKLALVRLLLAHGGKAVKFKEDQKELSNLMSRECNKQSNEDECRRCNEAVELMALFMTKNPAIQLSNGQVPTDQKKPVKI